MPAQKAAVPMAALAVAPAIGRAASSNAL